MNSSNRLISDEIVKKIEKLRAEISIDDKRPQIIRTGRGEVVDAENGEPSPEASVITFISARVSDLILAPGVPPSRVRPLEIFLRGKLIFAGGLLCPVCLNKSATVPLIFLRLLRKT
ncbi:hypothetical protein LguiA_018146 [Lonicera macranthoides]